MAYTRDYTVNFGKGKADLATVRYQVRDANQLIITAWTVAGVVQTEPGTGSYSVSVPFQDNFTGRLTIDTGDANPLSYSWSINPGSDENMDAKVSSRSTFAGGAVASVTGNVGGNVAGSVGSVVGSVGSVAAAVAVAANGMNAVLVAGVPAPEAWRRTGAMVAGRLTGANTDLESYEDFAGDLCVQMVCDARGNREVTYL